MRRIAIVSRYKAAKLCCSLLTYRHFPHYNNFLQFAASYVTCIPTRVYRNRSVGVLRNLFGDQKSLCVQASPQEAGEQVLNEFIAAMDEPDEAAREEVCLRYIQRLCATGNTLPATKIINVLRVRNIMLSTSAYNYLLEAAAARNDIYMQLEIFKDLLFSCHCIEFMSYLILARAFLSHNDAEILLSFITQVSDMEYPRNDVVLNRIIFALDKTGQVDKALLVFQHMKVLKCRPDLVTYNTILAFLGRLGRVDEMLREFALMKSGDLVPDIFTYNTMLNSLRKMGRLDLCLMYFKEMTDQGIQPDVLTFKDLIESLGRSGNIKVALEVFDKMKSMGICPSIHIYRAIIFSLKRTGKEELALKLSYEMDQCLPYSPVPREFQSGN